MITPPTSRRGSTSEDGALITFIFVHSQSILCSRFPFACHGAPRRRRNPLASNVATTHWPPSPSDDALRYIRFPPSGTIFLHAGTAAKGSRAGLQSAAESLRLPVATSGK